MLSLQLAIAVAVGMAIGSSLSCRNVEAGRRSVAEAYVASHPELSEEARENILAGRVSKGMPRDQVIASLGGIPCQPPLHRWTSDGVENEFCDLHGEEWHSGQILLFKEGRLIGWGEYKH